MGTQHPNPIARRLNRWRLRKSPMKVAFLLFLWLIALMSEARAQGDLKNNGGTIINTGIIRVKNAATGLPSVNGGVFEFFGANQAIPSMSYQDLKFTGSGTKTLNAGTSHIAGTLTIAAGVTATAPSGSDFTLGGTLDEQGYLLGTISKSATLAGGSGSSTFGNIGASVSWTGTAPGATTITRVTGVTSTGNGHQSIKRYFDIAPTFATGLNATLVFKYADVELNGQDPNSLTLWRSNDGGVTWRHQGGTVDVTNHIITKSNIPDFSRWTAADASNPLGPVGIEWVAQNLVGTSGGGQSGSVNTNLGSPFVTTVTDAYGNPIAGTTVTFSIAGVPSGASGQNLSSTTAVTNSSGQATTTLHLGSVAGVYTVTAASGSLVGSPLSFTATATGGSTPPPPQPPIPTSLTLIAGNNQVDSVGRQVANPLVVRILDQYGAPYAGVTVNFAILSTPVGATGYQISTSSVVTNSTGLATTALTLGSRTGDYKVVATSTALAGASITFTVKAIPAHAAMLALVSGDGLSQATKTVLTQPFIVRTLDLFGNPVAGVPVTFAVDSLPTNAVGQSLSNTNATTDVAGYATTILTLGDKAGVYRVSAIAAALTGSPLYFRSIATALNAPSSLVYTAGDRQTGQVRTTLANPLVVTVVDPNGNPVAAQPVTFAIAGTPAGAIGAAVSDTLVFTNLLGQASTQLFLGSKAGAYSVSVSSDSLSGSPITLTATAVAGPTIFLAMTSGTGQSASVRTTVPLPLVVAATDSFGNTKQGVSVRFALTQFPAGAAGQILSDTNVVTGNDGRASTRLTLGDSVGVYEVSASSGTLLGSPVKFSVNATASSSSATIILAAGDGQLGAVSTALSAPFVVTVRNSNGNIVAGVPVTFSIIEAPAGATGQNLTVVQGLTNSLGQASAILTLGNKPGVYKVAASSNGLTGSPVLFAATAEAGKAATLTLVSGSNQAGVIRTRLLQPFVVSVVDGDGNAVPGIAVTFAVDSIPAGALGQSFNGAPTAVVTTNANGQALGYLTLGDLTGVYRVTATSAGVAGSPVVFRANAVNSSGASRIIYTAGNAQSGPILTELGTPLSVTVLSATGNPVVGQTVVFAVDSTPVAATGQLLLPVTATTDAAGRASTVVRLGNKLGVYKVTASASGLAGSPVEFRITATLGAARSLAYVTGNNQSNLITSTLDTAFVVRVFDAGENPVPGVAVQFALDSLPNGATGQVLNVLNSITDAQGQAAAILTLGDRPGVYKVTASSSILVGSPVAFRATATAPAGAASIVATTGDAQTAQVLTELPKPVVVSVLDANGRPVPGQAVTFAIDSLPSGATGQAIIPSTTVTDLSGKASAFVKLGSKVGVYRIAATAEGLAGSPVRLTARATVGSPTAVLSLSGDGQTGNILAQLLSPFSVTVVDVAGNPVPGVTVKFAIDSIPAAAVGQSLSVTSMVTDVNGRASTMLTFGNKEGRYSVLASSDGLAVGSVRFTATAIVVRGDVNNNREIDIADLTSVIDHILGRIKLVGNDSVRADINKDGVINIADVVSLQNSILGVTPSGTSLEVGDSIAPVAALPSSSIQSTGVDTALVNSEFVLTDGGVRFNVVNSVPLKGLELIVRFRNPVSFRTPDVIFPRAQMDSFFVSTSGREVRIVAYNLQNTPIAVGDGSLFRLPLLLNSLDDIESSQLIISTSDTSSVFDIATKTTPEKRLVKPTEIPQNFVLYQNYPNPFNGTTKIEYEVPDIQGRGSKVLLQVFDVLGSKIRTLYSGVRAGGRYSVMWDGSDEYGNKVSSGTYYYRLISGTYVSGKKMILLK